MKNVGTSIAKTFAEWLQWQSDPSALEVLDFIRIIDDPLKVNIVPARGSLRFVFSDHSFFVARS